MMVDTIQVYKNNLKWYTFKMEFRQFEDGSCDLIFTDQEIEILNKNKNLQ